MRLIKETEFKSSPDGSIFAQEIESQLWKRVCELKNNNLNYHQLIDGLFGAIPVIEEFFDKVLVMAEDPAVRGNRLGLLQQIAGLANGIADLSRLEGF